MRYNKESFFALNTFGHIRIASLASIEFDLAGCVRKIYMKHSSRLAIKAPKIANSLKIKWKA